MLCTSVCVFVCFLHYSLYPFFAFMHKYIIYNTLCEELYSDIYMQAACKMIIIIIIIIGSASCDDPYLHIWDQWHARHHCSLENFAERKKSEI